MWIICVNCGDMGYEIVPEGRLCPTCKQSSLWFTNQDPSDTKTLGDLYEIAKIPIS
jgi:hypothetical protein